MNIQERTAKMRNEAIQFIGMWRIQAEKRYVANAGRVPDISLKRHLST